MTTTPTETETDPLPKALEGTEIVKDEDSVAPDPAPAGDTERTDPEPEESDLEKIAPKVDAKTYTFGKELKDKDKLVCTQRTLSFFGKLETFALLGDALDRALSGGASFDSIMSLIPGSSEKIAPEMVLRVATKLIAYAPELLLDLYCVWLNIPRDKRWEAKAILEIEIDDDIGFEIVETFVDQNGQVISDFFTEKIPKLAERIKVRFSLEDLAQSKPSSDTPPDTRSE